MSTESTLSSASNLQLDYMELLVAQLKYQNPLEPLNNNEMATQLAQFSQLQQLESMNSNFAKVLETTELNYANSLLGKSISFFAQDEMGGAGVYNAVVEQVSKDINDGSVVLVAGDYMIGLGDVISVNN